MTATRPTPRKRSRAVTLALMGTGAGAGIALGLWLWNTSSGVDAAAFGSVDQCVDSGLYERAACADAFAEAERHHAETAPRYATRADCEADFAPGECGELPAAAASGTGPSYVPVLAGFLLGRALGGAMTPVQPLYRSCSANPAQPCAGGVGGRTGGGLYTGSGSYVSNGYGRTRVQPTAFSSAGTTTQTMSRGGFGARAASMSAAS